MFAQFPPKPSRHRLALGTCFSQSRMVVLACQTLELIGLVTWARFPNSKTAPMSPVRSTCVARDCSMGHVEPTHDHAGFADPGMIAGCCMSLQVHTQSRLSDNVIQTMKLHDNGVRSADRSMYDAVHRFALQLSH